MTKIQNQNVEALSAAGGTNGVHHEIAELEEKLAAAKQKAIESGILETGYQEVLKNTVKEHIDEKRQKILQGLEQSGIKDAEAQDHATNLKEQEENKQISELVDVAKVKGPFAAYHIIEKIGGGQGQIAHMEDRLHSELVKLFEGGEMNINKNL